MTTTSHCGPLFRGLGSKVMLAADLDMPAAEVRSSFWTKKPRNRAELFCFFLCWSLDFVLVLR